MRNGFRIAGVALLAAGLGGAFAQETKTVKPGTPVTITVTQAQPSSPPVSITLGSRHGHVTPDRVGCTHTAGGNVDVQQPSSDTIVVTVTGVAVAYGTCHGSTATMGADVEQCFEIAFDNPKVKKAKMTIEGRVVGLLRSHCKGGTAAYDHAVASVTCGPSPLLTLSMPPHAVGNGENLSVNDREGPVSMQVQPGKFTLHQKFVVTATAPKCLLPGKAPSAEFAPDALDPLWISYKEPFKGASKKDFGFQVTIKVAEETNGEEEKKADNKPDNKPAELPKVEEKK